MPAMRNLDKRVACLDCSDAKTCCICDFGMWNQFFFPRTRRRTTYHCISRRKGAIHRPKHTHTHTSTPSLFSKAEAPVSWMYHWFKFHLLFLIRSLDSRI
jgi:hypothetical protein